MNDRENSYAGGFNLVGGYVWSAGKNDFARSFNATWRARAWKRYDLVAGAFKRVSDAIAERGL